MILLSVFGILSRLEGQKRDREQRVHCQQPNERTWRSFFVVFGRLNNRNVWTAWICGPNDCSSIHLDIYSSIIGLNDYFSLWLIRTLTNPTTSNYCQVIVNYQACSQTQNSFNLVAPQSTLVNFLTATVTMPLLLLKATFVSVRHP